MKRNFHIERFQLFFRNLRLNKIIIGMFFPDIFFVVDAAQNFSVAFCSCAIVCFIYNKQINLTAENFFMFILDNVTLQVLKRQEYNGSFPCRESGLYDGLISDQIIA